MPADTGPFAGAARSERALGGPPSGEASRPSSRKPLPPWLRAILSDPVFVPSLGVFALLVAWACNEAGYPQTHWAPGGIVVLALLAIAIGAAGLKRARTPRVVKVAIASLAAYTSFSFISILWANVPGDAWEGADRTLLYLLVFALLATWRRPGAAAAMLLGAWALALAGLAVFTVLHIDAVSSSRSELEALMPEGRLTYPAGYTNANAAMWMMAFFPALILSSARAVNWALRGMLAGGAVVLADVALYSQSRGSVYSIPIVLTLIFLLLRGRVRTFATLVPIAAGVGIAAPKILHLDERIEAGSGAASAIHTATLLVLAGATAVTVLVAFAAAMESRRMRSPRTEARVHRGIAIVGVFVVLAIVAGGLIAVGNPIARAEREWHTFTSLRGYGANSEGESRLIGGLGSNRYDFYRVAWHEFVTHPVGGIGAENFAEPYLRLGKSSETPHYPHSVELRTLSETGLVGTLLALAGLIASLIAGMRVLRGRDALASTVAAAALGGFAYWVVHGSFDWFFEYAGLGAAAFALLGLVCSLCPADVAREGEAHALGGVSGAGADAYGGVSGTGGGVHGGVPGAGLDVPEGVSGRVAAIALAALLALAITASFALPSLSRSEVESAAKVWPSERGVAYSRLLEAASLNPLSDEPYLVSGSIALRLGEFARADKQFELALQRVPGDAYATLERGAIASSLGQRSRALPLLRRAAYLNPRDPITRHALSEARRGQRVNVTALNEEILREAQHFSS